MPTPTHEQLVWVEQARVSETNYDAVDDLINLQSTPWTHVEALNYFQGLLYSNQIQTVRDAIFKLIELSWHYRKTNATVEIFLPTVFRDNLGYMLCSKHESLMFAFDWFERFFIPRIASKDACYELGIDPDTHGEWTVYETLKSFLMMPPSNQLDAQGGHSTHVYTPQLNHSKVLIHNNKHHIAPSQLDWITQALKLETRFNSGCELEQHISAVSWDTPEFLDACKDVFYSSQFETARFITFKYIQLSLKHQRLSPAASAGMMQFLYKNLGAILRQPIHDLDMLLLWFNTMYIPPRTPQQLEPYYEYHCARAQYEQALKLNHEGKGTNPEYTRVMVEWDAERTVYKTLKDYVFTINSKH